MIIIVVIFGKVLLVLIIVDMVKKMKYGLVIVDLVVECGGNVEGIVKNEKMFVDGVIIIGYIDYFFCVFVYVF